MGQAGRFLPRAGCRRWALSLGGVLLWLVCTSQVGWAHKVTIFAWVEGDTVYTQSKFSGGKKAKNSTVVVLDPEGHQLLEGKTDENGEFSFKVPQYTDLKVVLKASMGHLGEWTIPAEEISGDETDGDAVPEKRSLASPEKFTGNDGGSVEQKPPAQTVTGVTREEISLLVGKVLDKKMAPIMNMLVAAQDKGPTLDKIVGGVGYILGLVGVAFYFSARKKKK